MKRFIYLFIIVIMIVSCGVKTKNVKVVERKLPIENFVDTFLINHSNLYQNDVIYNDVNKIFVKEIINKLQNDNIIYGLPLQLEDINRVGDNNVVHFGSWIEPDGWEYKGKLDNVYVDIIAYVNDFLMHKLQNDEYYTFVGKFIKSIEIDEARNLIGKNIRAYNNIISIGKEKNDPFYKEKVDVNLGIMYFKVDSIFDFNGRQNDSIIIK